MRMDLFSVLKKAVFVFLCYVYKGPVPNFSRLALVQNLNSLGLTQAHLGTNAERSRVNRPGPDLNHLALAHTNHSLNFTLFSRTSQENTFKTCSGLRITFLIIRPLHRSNVQGDEPHVEQFTGNINSLARDCFSFVIQTCFRIVIIHKGFTMQFRKAQESLFSCVKCTAHTCQIHKTPHKQKMVKL